MSCFYYSILPRGISACHRPRRNGNRLFVLIHLSSVDEDVLLRQCYSRASRDMYLAQGYTAGWLLA